MGDMRLIIRKPKEPTFCAPQLTSALLEEIRKEVTCQTIQNILKEAGYNERVGRKMPFVNKKYERLYSSTVSILKDSTC